MNFVLDANIPFSTKAVFHLYGKTIHVRDVGRQHGPDDEVMWFAVEQQAILVTRDLDFGNPYLYPVEHHFGLIILRVPFYYSADSINDVLRMFLEKVNVSELRGVVTVVEPGRIRIRKG